MDESYSTKLDLRWETKQLVKYCFMQSSSDAFSCLALVRKLAVRTVREVQYFGILQFSQGKQVFRRKPNTLQHSRAISALYHMTKPKLLEKQTMHKADLIPFERVILTG